MKKLLFPAIMIITLLLLMAISGCRTSSMSVATAKANVHKAYNALDDAENRKRAEMAEFRFHASERLQENAKTMADFQARKSDDRADTKADYKKRMRDLEKRNTELNKRLDHFKATNRSDLRRFKSRFERELGNLSGSIHDLTHRD